MGVSMQSQRAYNRIQMGQSCWQATLRNGRMVCEADGMEWLEDIVASGDSANIVELVLCTPQGDVHVDVGEPYSAFQFHQGLLTLHNERVQTAQIIGVVTDKLTGACVAAIWDVSMQRLYLPLHTSVLHFASWRPGIIAPGLLNWQAMGVRL